MRNLNDLDRWRVREPEILKRFGSYGDHTCGVFRLDFADPAHPHSTTVTLLCIASCGEGWDHVSVSLPTRCPTWGEMDFIKRRFFKPDEPAMQLHPPERDHISHHPYCLHLWRPQTPRAGRIPFPPQRFVA
jgi:hypothetical protein